MYKNALLGCTYSPPSLQHFSLVIVMKILNELNIMLHMLKECNINFNFPWLRKDQNPFIGFPAAVIEEIIQGLTKLTATTKVELFQILLCKPLKNVTLRDVKVRENNVLRTLQIIASTQPNLKYLDLTIWRLPSEGNTSLSSSLALNILKDYVRCLSSLIYLDLSDMYDDETLEIIGTSCPNLNVLVVQSEKITSEGLKNLAVNTKDPNDQSRRCRELQKVILCRSHSFLNEGLECLLFNLPQLNYLGGFELDLKPTLKEISEKMTELPKFSLTVLNYLFSDEDSDDFLVYPSIIAKAFPHLMQLNLLHPTSEELQQFEYMESLRCVSVIEPESSDSFSNVFASFLHKIGKSLEILNLIYFEDIMFNVINQYCPKLKKLQFHSSWVAREQTLRDSPMFKNLEGLYLQTIGYDITWQPSDCVLLLSKCLGLHSLSVRCCPDLKEEHLLEVLRVNPLKHLHEFHVESKSLHLASTFGQPVELEEVASLESFI